MGNDLISNILLNGQYNPQLVSHISSTISSKFRGKDFQLSLSALFKQHQIIVRSILNRTEDENFRYEVDLGFDTDLLTGHSERNDGQKVIVSDINAPKCTAAGKYNRCYKGDITIRVGTNRTENKGTFDFSWGRDSTKLDVKVSNHIELLFDHTHTGCLWDTDFSSKTTIKTKTLQSSEQIAFSYSCSLDKEDGKWNDFQLQTSLTDVKSGRKAFSTDARFNQKITDKRSGQFQRKINVNAESFGNESKRILE